MKPTNVKSSNNRYDSARDLREAPPVRMKDREYLGYRVSHSKTADKQDVLTSDAKKA